MGKRDPRVDAYIEKQADFARPVLTHIRNVVHEGCPDVNETIKRGVPSFEHHGILCGMAAFKAHLQWITEAKQEETRRRRIAQAVEWIAEGKARNWKYV